MNKPTINLGRRTFLRGFGASVALPSFRSLGAEVKAAAAAQGVTATGAPLRMAYLYVPNGVIMDKWRPEGSGSDFSFNESMKSLNGLKNDLQIIKGLEQANGWAGSDGAGDHARSGATFLTGVRAKKTAGSDIRLGISARPDGGEPIWALRHVCPHWSCLVMPSASRGIVIRVTRARISITCHGAPPHSR